MEPDHRVIVMCACGHKGFLSKEELLRHPRVHGYEKVLGLRFLLRCALCKKRGRVEITLKRFAPF